jgi:hypothetical protein
MPDIGGAVSGGVSLIGGLMGSDASSDAADAQVAASREANELQKYMYDTAREDQAPWRETGGAAVNYIAQILGIPGYGGGTTASSASGVTATSLKAPNLEDYRIGTPANAATRQRATSPESFVPQAAASYYLDPDTGQIRQTAFGNTAPGSAQYDYAKYNAALEDYKNALSSSTSTTAGTPLDLTGILRATPGYQFQVGEGTKAIERSAAARGGLLSGAAGKALTTYSQGVADQTYNNYLNSLMSVAGLGQNSANTTTSAGTSYANAASNNILSAGNAKASGYINSANALTGGMSSGMNNYLLYSMLNKNAGLTSDQANYAKNYFGWPS